MPALSSINKFIGDGARTHWEISFDGGYILQSHVLVRRNNVFTPAVFAAESTVVISPPVPNGEEFEVHRRTPKDRPIVDFAKGARLTENNLDTIAKQAVFVAAEAIDRGEGALEDVLPRLLAGQANEIAPTLDPLAIVKGKLLAVNQAGTRIIGVPFSPSGDIDFETGLILHEGQSLDEYLNNLNTLVAAEKARLDAQVNELIALSDDVVANATSTAEIDAALAQLTTDFTALSGVVDALTALEGDTAGLSTLIANETAARISGDNAMAATIALIGAKNGANNAFILNLDTVKVSSTESLSQRLTALKAQSDSNLALIQQESLTRASDISAEATARTQMGASIRNDLGNNLAAAIAEEASVRSAADTAEANARTTLAATLRGETDTKINAAVTNVTNARIAGDNAEATARTTLAATLRSETDTKVSAAVSNEATARISGDNALASTISLIGAKNGAGSAFILDSNTVLLTGGVSLTNRLSSIDANIGANAAAITNEASARANGDSALSTQISTLTSRTTAAEAAISSEATTRANADTALTNSVNSLTSRTTAAEAAITSEATTRANADSALTTQINSLSSRTDAAEAAISSEATTRANVDGALSSQITTLTATTNNLSASVTTQATAISDLQGRTEAFWEVTAVAGGRAKLRVYADAVSGGGVDIEGDVRISGDLLVNGTVTANQLAAGAVTQFGQELNWNLIIARTNTGSVDSPGVTISGPQGSVKVDVSCFLSVGTFANDTTVDVQLIRISGGVTTYIGQPFSRSFGETGYLTFFAMDTPPAGTPATYKLRLTKSAGGDAATISGGQLLAVEYKK